MLCRVRFQAGCRGQLLHGSDRAWSLQALPRGRGFSLLLEREMHLHVKVRKDSGGQFSSFFILFSPSPQPPSLLFGIHVPLMKRQVITGEILGFLKLWDPVEHPC